MNDATLISNKKISSNVTSLLFSKAWQLRARHTAHGTRHNTQCTSCMGTTRMTMEIESQEELRSFFRTAVYSRSVRAQLRLFRFGTFNAFLPGLGMFVSPTAFNLQLKSVQQSRQQALRAYCLDICTVLRPQPCSAYYSCHSRLIKVDRPFSCIISLLASSCQASGAGLWGASMARLHISC